jgi:hypothetical protein
MEHIREWWQACRILDGTRRKRDKSKKVRQRLMNISLMLSHFAVVTSTENVT